MARNKEFAGWTFAECKGCGVVFSIEDKKGDWNDTPPDRKFYCPDCEKKGLKNKKTKETPEEFIKANGITDKDIIREFKKRVKDFKGKRLSFTNLLKEAVEIVGYKNKLK